MWSFFNIHSFIIREMTKCISRRSWEVMGGVSNVSFSVLVLSPSWVLSTSASQADWIVCKLRAECSQSHGLYLLAQTSGSRRISSTDNLCYLKLLWSNAFKCLWILSILYYSIEIEVWFRSVSRRENASLQFDSFSPNVFPLWLFNPSQLLLSL